ncbi:sigma-70 family RNA polymerase sigma factor [Sulfurivermis fontis]|uniref:sigma-70 family RNA polymerase sigma factor n=1 Tax=Sulfurivermis fontis TaxID=1972068 RepID=UPI000FDBC3E4|nr:sigma-70 family RNA polymerase sigma factor [Sulfurivermis fontis]
MSPDITPTDGTFDTAAIIALRSDMLRFASLQLRDTAAAEDAVQEAMAAACAAQERYAGRAQLKTWVFAILRNKIIDIIRERARHPVQSYDDGIALDDELDGQFNEHGYWRKEERPTDWGRPEQELENGQFWQVFDACLHHLPENTARVFMMREMLGLETAEICKELAISESNCWVILHRARSRLRLCLEESWFDGEKP